jgi:hypothetical protein
MYRLRSWLLRRCGDEDVMEATGIDYERKNLSMVVTAFDLRLRVLGNGGE